MTKPSRRVEEQERAQHERSRRKREAADEERARQLNTIGDLMWGDEGIDDPPPQK